MTTLKRISERIPRSLLLGERANIKMTISLRGKIPCRLFQGNLQFYADPSTQLTNEMAQDVF